MTDNPTIVPSNLPPPPSTPAELLALFADGTRDAIASQNVSRHPGAQVHCENCNHTHECRRTPGGRLSWSHCLDPSCAPHAVLYDPLARLRRALALYEVSLRPVIVDVVEVTDLDTPDLDTPIPPAVEESQ